MSVSTKHMLLLLLIFRRVPSFISTHTSLRWSCPETRIYTPVSLVMKPRHVSLQTRQHSFRSATNTSKQRRRQMADFSSGWLDFDEGFSRPLQVFSSFSSAFPPPIQEWIASRFQLTSLPIILSTIAPSSAILLRRTSRAVWQTMTR